MRPLFKIILFILLYSWGLPLVASPADTTLTPQSEVVPRIPEKEVIEDYKKDSDLNYEHIYQEDRSWWDNFWGWLKRKVGELFDIPTTDSENSLPIYVWIILGLAVVGIVFFIFRNEISTLWGKRNVKSTQTLKTEFVDLSVDANTLETQLQTAINEKDYKEAVRLCYTLSLKQLVEAGHIEFRIEKTNSEYLFELPQGILREPFKQLTFYFDYIFYGNFEATEAVFEKAQQQYKTLSANLKKVFTK